MLRLSSVLAMAFAVFLAACAPSAQEVPPSEWTPPATSAPIPETATLPVPNEATFTPVVSGGLKPADSETPTAGLCDEAHEEPVSIVLGLGPDGIPLAGRCIQITPAQRIKLINQSNGPFNTQFGEYHIDLAVDSELLLDKPVGQYLAQGVHFLPMGPELWVQKGAVVTIATTPSPIIPYENPVVGYKLGLPGDWLIDENGMTNGLNQAVVFYPPNAEPSSAYLSISLDPRPLDQIISLYAQSVPEATREDTFFNGYIAIRYTYAYQNNAYRIEYYLPYGGQVYLIATDKPNEGIVQSILMTFQFMAPPQPVTHEATVMVDNGKTVVMNVGDKLRINLDYAYGWSTTSDFNSAVLMGAADGYFAIASGTTTLTLTGNPECLNLTPPCGLPSVMFTITVVVP